MRSVFACLMCCFISVNFANGEDDRKPTVAPPDHALLSNTIDGWYFVPKEFKEKYDATLARLEALQADVANGKVRAAKAKDELAELKQKLEGLRKDIEARRVHVKGAALYDQSETIEFELGAQRKLSITGNQVHVIGWDGPKVKCVLKKIVLSPDDKPVDEHLKAIKLVHKHGRAEFAGQTPAELDAYEKEYLAQNKLNAEQLANRRKLLNSIAAERSVYRDYVGQEIDQISIDGLDYESNKVVSLNVMSKGGTGQYGSVRQRYGELTVYVPTAAGVVVRGAERGLIVEKLNAPLTIVPDDSTDSNDRGVFEVKDLKGDLVCRNFPLKSISHVTGHIAINSKLLFDADRGTSHYDSFRDMHPGKGQPVQIQHVSGGVNLQYGFVTLELSEIQGTLNVVNEYGDTKLVATQKFDPQAHRIISQGGRIDVELSADAWSSISVLAGTNYGGVKTNIAREEFDDLSLEGPDKQDGSRRPLSGFYTVVKPEGDEPAFLAKFGLLDRYQLAFEDQARKPGLDILTRGGGITVIRK